MSHNRLTRQEIKRDAVMETLSSIAHWLTENTRNLLIGFAALLVAILAVAGFYAYRQGREDDAAEKLNEATTVLREEAGEADAASRDERARLLFEEVRTDYSGTSAAEIADVYLGEIAAGEGELESARDHWEAFLDRQGDHMLASTVRVNLMSLDRLEGRSEDLAGRLQAEIDGGESDLPTDVLLYQLAVTQEDLGDDEAARATWSRLADEHPTSPFAVQARTRSGSVGPGLADLGAPFPGA